MRVRLCWGGRLQAPAMKATSAAPVARFRGRYRSRIRSQAIEGLYPSRECHDLSAAAFELGLSAVRVCIMENEPECSHRAVSTLRPKIQSRVRKSIELFSKCH